MHLSLQFSAISSYHNQNEICRQHIHINLNADSNSIIKHTDAVLHDDKNTIHTGLWLCDLWYIE